MADIDLIALKREITEFLDNRDANSYGHKGEFRARHDFDGRSSAVGAPHVVAGARWGGFRPAPQQRGSLVALLWPCRLSRRRFLCFLLSKRKSFKVFCSAGLGRDGSRCPLWEEPHTPSAAFRDLSYL